MTASILVHTHAGPAVEVVDLALCRARTKPFQPDRLRQLLVEERTAYRQARR